MSETKQKNTKILVLLFVGVLMGALDISIVGPAIPSIEQTIKIDPKFLGWIFSIYILFNLVGISLFAKLSDFFGRRIIYITSVSIFAFGSLLVSLSDDYTLLLIGRAIQGFGASGIFPVASAVIGDVFPPEKRGRTLGLIGAVWGIAFILGPVIAGTLLAFFQWHILFLVNLPIALFLVVGAWNILPGKAHVTTGKFDWKGVLVLGLMLSSFAYGVNSIDPKNFFTSLVSYHSLPFLISALIFLSLFILAEKDVAAPVINLQLFYSRQIRLVGIIGICTGLFQSSFAFIPDMLVKWKHYTSAQASFWLLPIVISLAIASPIWGRILDKIGSKLIVIAGLILTGTGYLLMSFMNDTMFIVASIILGFGLAVLAGSSLRYIILNEVSASERASTQGVLTIMISIGQMLGAVVIGAITATADSGYRKSFLFLGFVVSVLIGVSLFLKNRKEELITAQNKLVQEDRDK